MSVRVQIRCKSELSHVRLTDVQERGEQYLKTARRRFCRSEFDGCGSVMCNEGRRDDGFRGDVRVL